MLLKVPLSFLEPKKQTNIIYCLKSMQNPTGSFLLHIYHDKNKWKKIFKQWKKLLTFYGFTLFLKQKIGWFSDDTNC